jgi:hypothetical protein
MLRAIGYGLLAGLIFACLSQLSGCSAEVLTYVPRVTLTHSEPDEYGVVCYSKGYDSSPISCVQVQEGHK